MMVLRSILYGSLHVFWSLADSYYLVDLDEISKDVINTVLTDMETKFQWIPHSMALWFDFVNQRQRSYLSEIGRNPHACRDRLEQYQFTCIRHRL